MGAVGSLHGVSAEVESLAVSWRDALVTGDKEATARCDTPVCSIGPIDGASAAPPCAEWAKKTQRPSLVPLASRRVVDMAVQAGVSPRDLLELVRAAREEHEATSKGAEDARAEESDEAEVLEGFEDVVALMKEGTPGRPSKPKKKHGKKLLRALREVAGAHLAETSAA